MKLLIRKEFDGDFTRYESNNEQRATGKKIKIKF